MHKILYFATIGLLAFSIGGCGDGGGNTASPSPTPSAASPSPAVSVKPTPGAQAFASPVVVAAGPSGLIRSTNPDQRAKQTQTDIDDKKNQPKKTPDQFIPPGPSTPNPAQIDPFSALPPIAVQNPSGTGPAGIPAGPMTANPLPKLPPRLIAVLSKMPELTRPVQIGGTKLKGPAAPQINLSPTARGVVSAGPMTANPLPKLPQRLVATIPKLPELSRPVQIGGTKLRGPAAPQINLSPTARGLVSEFRTLQALLDDTSQYSEYDTDLRTLVETIYGKEGQKNSVRRELLLTNRPFFRRIQKTLDEYVTASNLWRFYGEKSPADALRCSIVPAIAEAIEVYRPPTERRGELSCVTRINLLQAVWRQGKNRLDAAVRDQDYNARTIAKAPILPVLSETPTNPAPAGEKALGREVASLPQVPGLNPPPVPRRPVAGSPVKQVPAVPAPPPPPSTDLATGTEVSGVVKVGNETQVIVRVPNEPTSRYVKVGQRLSNGRVLVKRVDVKSGADPIVILEENGVEVAKAVGEKPPSREPKPANAVISSLPNTNKATGR